MLQNVSIHRYFVLREHRLISLGGGVEGGPRSETTEEPDLPKKEAPGDGPLPITPPPTEEEDVGGKKKDEVKVDGVEGERDRRNLETGIKNINISQDNVEHDLEAEQALRQRLDVWLKGSIESLLSYSSDTLDKGQMRFVSEQTRFVRRLEQSFQAITQEGIQLLNQKIGSNPQDPRYTYLQQVVQRNTGETNRLGAIAEAEGSTLVHAVEKLDVQLDEKQGISTPTPLDQPISPDSASFLHQFTENQEVTKAVNTVLQALEKRDGGSTPGRLFSKINRFVAGESFDVKLAQIHLGSIWNKMNPTQQGVFMKWFAERLQAHTPPYKVERKGGIFTFEQV